MSNACKAGGEPARALSKDLERMLNRVDVGIHNLGQVSRFELAEYMRFVRRQGTPSVTEVLRAWSGVISLMEYTFMSFLQTHAEFSELRPTILDALRGIEQGTSAPASPED